ncbi:MAG: hypothetical protein HY560_04840 [Gemmatimonadetes bacterium]|nr:hypothetical protein [Gemmatimonadota bacterium]
MSDDSTLGGYLRVHDRPPAFEGSDGAAYSVAVYLDDAPGADGRFGAALLFVRWSPAGEQPAGHLETEYLTFGRTPAEADEQLRALSLHEVKGHLDRLIDRAKELPAW